MLPFEFCGRLVAHTWWWRCVRAREAAAIIALFVSVASCSHDAPTQAAPAPDDDPLLAWSAPALFDTPVELVVPTYDGSGQSVHPDIVAFQDRWNGARFWMAMTPYPNSDQAYENPSILVTDDGQTLAVPDGFMNPLVMPFYGGGYNSDPDLTFDYARGELVLSYREVSNGQNTIKIMTSTTGTSWSRPHIAFAEQAHSAVSQSIVPATHSQPPLAWYVDAGKAGCSATSTTVVMRRATTLTASLGQTDWSDGTVTDMAQAGYVIWHMKVRYVPSKREYWALVAAFPADGRGCGGDDLFLMHSKNGLHWEGFPAPVLRHEDRLWTRLALYRGSFLYDPQTDELSVWFSARGDGGQWHMGFARFRYQALAARLSAAPPVFSRAGATSEREVWTEAP